MQLLLKFFQNNEMVRRAGIQPAFFVLALERAKAIKLVQSILAG